jgi:hypothetical protein
MPGDQDRTKPAAPRADAEDQLSPGRALRESAARGGGQRIGNNGPVANPDVSLPGEPADEPVDETRDEAGC